MALNRLLCIVIVISSGAALHLESHMSDPHSSAKVPSEWAREWLMGQPAIVILLIAIIGGGCYGVRWVAIDVVPAHIASFQATVREVQDANIKTISSLEASHREERQRTEDSARFERSEWRRFHIDSVDRIERVLGIKKAVGSSPLLEKELDSQLPVITKGN